MGETLTVNRSNSFPWLKKKYHDFALRYSEKKKKMAFLFLETRSQKVNNFTDSFGTSRTRISKGITDETSFEFCI